MFKPRFYENSHKMTVKWEKILDRNRCPFFQENMYSLQLQVITQDFVEFGKIADLQSIPFTHYRQQKNTSFVYTPPN